jgi:hypothetical protein
LFTVAITTAIVVHLRGASHVRPHCEVTKGLGILFRAVTTALTVITLLVVLVIVSVLAILVVVIVILILVLAVVVASVLVVWVIGVCVIVATNTTVSADRGECALNGTYDSS